MITDIGLQECNSFDEDDIDELEDQLAYLQGPSLDEFLMKEESPIVTLASKDTIKSIFDQEGRDLKFIGNDRYSEYQAFFYVLLLIGVQQKRNYPHLNTLIRQQFYKPNIFSDSDQSRAEMALAESMLQKSLGYFEEIGEGVRLEQYIIREPIFEEAGIIMLRNSVQPQDVKGVYQQLSAKFNIDLKILRKENNSECYQFGVHNQYMIVREGDYYFVGTEEASNEMRQSKYDAESVQSAQSGLPFVLESQHSTPKFKNSQARFHKKSHRDSFGGDLEIVQCRDLLMMQTMRMKNLPKEVFSEMNDLKEKQRFEQNNFDSDLKTHTFQDIIHSQMDIDNLKKEMKGSTTLEPTYNNFLQRRKDRKISSSEIIEYKDFGIKMMRHESLPQCYNEDEEKESKGNSYNSLVMVNEQVGKMRASEIQRKQLERIVQLQSSQKQSTHLDQQSEPSDFQNESPLAVDNEIQMKLKDRKYSYFTQQMASKNRKQKEIDSSNYVFKLPKNTHKNSEVILSGSHDEEYIKRRFEENPMRFSQFHSPSEDSLQEHEVNWRHRKPTLKLNSTIFSYFIKMEPTSWYKKETIYYLPNNQKEVHVFQKSFSPLPPQPILAAPVYQGPSNSYIQLKNSSSVLRDSFGSSNSFFSNLKSQQSFNLKEQTQPSKSYNPYQINESSFLKNRIQSLSQLQPYQPNKNEDSKSTIFPTSKSLKSIRLSPDKPPTKVTFNYFSSPSALKSSSLQIPSQYRPRNLSYNFIPQPNSPPISSNPHEIRSQSYGISAFQNRFSRAQ